MAAPHYDPFSYQMVWPPGPVAPFGPQLVYQNANPHGPAVTDETWINSQAINYQIAELKNTAIAIDATYYLRLQLDRGPREPLVSALGGLTGIQARLEADLEQFEKHDITPFFIFDGQPLVGQDEVSTSRGLQAHAKTDIAWDLYFNSQADTAVEAFGRITTAFQPQNLYPLLQSILRKRKLHFLTPPFNASAQIAYFEMVDSDQAGAIMGPLELMLYPINDCVIRSFDWDHGMVMAISKKHVLKSLNVSSESLFVDAFLMTGTPFLTPFPALSDPTITKIQPHTISDAVNILRTAEKLVSNACKTFSDVLKSKDPNWEDKYQKARMAVDHFIYITEDGEVKVHDSDHLTGNNHEYLGLQLPHELFHYLNTGLIGPRLLSWMTHGQITILPTLDGVASDEYKNLVTKQSSEIKKAALSLVTSRLNRGISHKPITMKVWYDRNYTSKVWDSHEQIDLRDLVSSWTVPKASAIAAQYPKLVQGSMIYEVMVLKKPELRALTLTKDTKAKPKPLENAADIQSLCLWRFLHIRGYINDKHELTAWGEALAAALSALEPTVNKNPEVLHLYEQVFVAFELLRFNVLNAKIQHEELRGFPMNGTAEEQASLLLISRCATLLKLQHMNNGYTGPLSKNLLWFRSLASEVRLADRDLVEGVLAHMFMFAQAKRDREDGWELSHQLPFLADPDVAMGIAVKTYFDSLEPGETAEVREIKTATFLKNMLPYTEAWTRDLEIACEFFESLNAGVQTLDEKSIPAADKATWAKAVKYLQLRR